MGKNISFYNKKIFNTSAFIAIILTYFIYIKYHVTVFLFVLLMYLSVLALLNSSYILNIKTSLLGKMNFKNKKIYGKLLLWGILNYLPILLFIFMYSICKEILFLFIILEFIIIEIINFYLICRSNNSNNSLIVFIINLTIYTITYFYIL